MTEPLAKARQMLSYLTALEEQSDKHELFALKRLHEDLVFESGGPNDDQLQVALAALGDLIEFGFTVHTTARYPALMERLRKALAPLSEKHPAESRG